MGQLGVGTRKMQISKSFVFTGEEDEISVGEHDDGYALVRAAQQLHEPLARARPPP